MATIYESQRPRDEPQVHVLVIGVGAYPHVAAHQADPRCPPFTDLTAPPTSARRLAEWLLENDSLLQLPLGSIEAATSDGVPIVTTAGSMPTSGATMAEIKRAFDRWEARCHQNKANVSLFYFCGHGLTAGMSTLLLTSDFFESPARPFENAIRLESTMSGMAANRSQCQLYLVDCCRTSPENYHPVIPAEAGQSLKDLTPQDFPLSSHCSVALYSAKHGAPAFAPALAAPTPFVELILEGIELGACASRRTQDWFVSPWTLAEKAPTLAHLQRRRTNGNLPTDPYFGLLPHFFDKSLDQALRSLVDPPQVPTKVYLVNGSANGATELQFAQAGAMVHSVAQAAWTAPDEIDTVLPGGDTEIMVVDPTQPGPRTSKCFIDPAHTIVRVSS